MVTTIGDSLTARRFVFVFELKLMTALSTVWLQCDRWHERVATRFAISFRFRWKRRFSHETNYLEVFFCVHVWVFSWFRRWICFNWSGETRFISQRVCFRCYYGLAGELYILGWPHSALIRLGNVCSAKMHPVEWRENTSINPANDESIPNAMKWLEIAPLRISNKAHFAINFQINGSPAWNIWKLVEIDCDNSGASDADPVCFETYRRFMQAIGHKLNRYRLTKSRYCLQSKHINKTAAVRPHF